MDLPPGRPPRADVSDGPYSQRLKRKTEQYEDGIRADGPVELYLVRHAESLANATGHDIRDSPLTARGEQQAAAWAYSGEPATWSVDLVLVSPLARAMQTAVVGLQPLFAGRRPPVCRKLSF